MAYGQPLLKRTPQQAAGNLPSKVFCQSYFARLTRSKTSASSIESLRGMRSQAGSRNCRIKICPCFLFYKNILLTKQPPEPPSPPDVLLVFRQTRFACPSLSTHASKSRHHPHQLAKLTCWHRHPCMSKYGRMTHFMQIRLSWTQLI